MKAKKWIAVLTALTMGATLGACAKPSNVLGTQANEFGMSAVSAAQLLKMSMPSAQTVGMLTKLLTAEEVTGGVESELGMVNRYLNAFDTMMNPDATVATEEKSDREGYAKKLVIGGMSADGTQTRHTMYFNEGEAVAETPEEDDEEEESEVKTKTAINGVMVMGEKEYELEGKRTVESEEGETETELELKAYLSGSNGKRDFVSVKQEIETEGDEIETEYFYSVHQNGKVIEKTKVKFEQEDNETEIALQFLVGEAKGNYAMQREVLSDNAARIKIKYNTNGHRGTIYATETVNDAGKKVYEYELGGDKDSIEMDKEDDD